jgi:predicted permease
MHETLLSFGLIILAGLGFRHLRVGRLDAHVLRDAINILVLNVFLPALSLSAMYEADIGREALLVPATAWVTTLLTLALSVSVFGYLARRTSLSPEVTGVLVITATFGNVTYLGLPVLRELFGPPAIKYALFYDLLATTPILWRIGAPVAARYGTGGKTSLAGSLRTVLTLPPIWGIFIGMALNLADIPVPGFLLKALEILGSVVVPLMIFSVGLSLTFPRVEQPWLMLPALAVKLALVPVIAYGAARALGLSGTALSACAVEGAMPPMVLALLISARFGLHVPLTAVLIVAGTALSFFTVPLALSLAG